MSRYQGAFWSNGSATPGMCFTVSSTAKRGINSNEVT